MLVPKISTMLIEMSWTSGNLFLQAHARIWSAEMGCLFSAEIEAGFLDCFNAKETVSFSPVTGPPLQRGLQGVSETSFSRPGVFPSVFWMAWLAELLGPGHPRSDRLRANKVPSNSQTQACSN